MPARRTPLRARSRAKSVRDAELDAVRPLVLARDGGCVLAGTADDPCWGPLAPHHKLRRSQGGRHTLENLVTLCATHHEWVHGHPAAARAMGLLESAHGR